VIIGVRSLQQLQSNIDAFQVELSEEQYGRLLALSTDSPHFPQSFIRGADYQSIPFLQEAGYII
jgi:diketogulonate reductase-like aldo/keto reductase